MGFINRTCEIIGLSANTYPGPPDFVLIDIVNHEGTKLHSLEIPAELYNLDDFSYDDLEKLATIFYNGIWPQGNSLKLRDDVTAFIDSNYPANTPIDKQDRVLDFFRSMTTYDGEGVNYNFFDPAQLWRKAYVENEYEFRFYFDSLEDSGFLKVLEKYPGSYAGISLTVSGLNKLVALDEKKRSKTCFVAMSFSGELKPVYEKGIAAAIRETGFEPLKIDDDASIASEQTINDAILAAIKKSQFTIADFTKQRAGVYFEAGYALGRGHKVIYTCREDDIGNAHFDTRNYPHILWKTAEDLKLQLINKIEVYIKG